MTGFDTFFLIGGGIAILLGLCIGLGHILRILVEHFPGKIIAGVLTYVLFGSVLNIEFVRQLTQKLIDTLVGKGGFFGKIFLVMRIDLIILAIALFLLLQLVLRLLAALLESVLNSDAIVPRVINRVGGALLSAGFFFLCILIFMQIASWVQGTNEVSFYAQNLTGSVFGFERLYLNNPLNSIVELIKKTIEGLRA